MKHVLFATVALAAAIAAPAFAAEGVIGTVDASYSRSNVEVGALGGDTDIDSVRLNGSVTVPTSSNWAVKLDAGYAKVDTDLGDADTFGGAAHAFYNNDSFLVGGFVSAGTIDDLDVDGWNVGVEAQKYLGNVTLAGQFAYGQLDALGADVDTWTLGGDVRYFINDNFRINGGLDWNRLDISGFDADVWNANLGAEYQFSSLPISVFGGYTHAEAEDLFDISSDAFTIGVRYTFGGVTLIQRDRAGADLSADALGFARSIF